MDLTFVDAFTDQTFAGNPAAVCFLDRAADDTWVQALARETNMPATAFLRAQGDGFALRWFSTIGELALCGHGTLAAAHALWDSGRLPRGELARFATRAGALGAAWHDGWVEMDFPAEPARPAEAPSALLRALAVEPLVCSRNRLDYLLELESEAAVRAVSPDAALLRTVETRGVIVTSRATTPGYDFVSRFFAPSAGILEDSVTGSAHCCLGPYWAERLGREEMTGYQASARGGAVRVRVRGGRVDLLGRAVTVRRATLTAG